MAVSKRPSVWIIQAQGDRVDYSQAENWGEVKPLLRGYVALNSPDLAGQVKQCMALIQEGDFLLLSGNKLLNGLIMHRVWEKHGVANILNWNGPLNRYESFKLVDTFGLI